MRVTVNRNKVQRMSEGEACGHVGSAVKVLVANQYSVLVVRNGYTISAVV